MPTNFVIGHLLMWFARHEISKEKTIWTTPLKWSWAYSLLIFVPVTAWYFYAHPGWSTVYLRPEEKIPGWTGPVIVSHYFLGMVLGTWLASGFLQAGRKKEFWMSLGVGVYWLAAVWVLTLDEYLHIGTYSEYHEGAAKKIFDVPAFQTQMNLMGAAMTLPAAALAIWFWRRSKSIR